MPLAAGGGVSAAENPAPGTAGAEEAQVEASLIVIGQQVGADASASGRRQRRLNASGDTEATIPVLRIGGGRGSLVGHLRSGLGTGVTTRNLYSGTLNGTGFEGEGPHDHYAIVAEAYYQHRHPLGGSPGSSSGG